MPTRIMSWNVQGVSGAPGPAMTLKRRLVLDIIAAAQPDVLFLCEMGTYQADACLAYFAGPGGMGHLNPQRGIHYAWLPSIDDKRYALLISPTYHRNRRGLGTWIGTAPLGLPTDGPRQVMALHGQIEGHWVWFVHAVSTRTRARALMFNCGRAAMMLGRRRLLRTRTVGLLGSSQSMPQVGLDPTGLGPYMRWKAAANLARARAQRVPQRPQVSGITTLYTSTHMRNMFQLTQRVVMFGDFNLAPLDALRALYNGARHQGWNGTGPIPFSICRPTGLSFTQRSGYFLDYAVGLGAQPQIRAVDLRGPIATAVRSLGHQLIGEGQDELRRAQLSPRASRLRAHVLAMLQQRLRARRRAAAHRMWMGALALARPQVFLLQGMAGQSPLLELGPDHLPVAYDLG